MDLIKIAEEAFATGKQHPSFKAGDTITVALVLKFLEMENYWMLQWPEKKLKTPKSIK